MSNRSEVRTTAPLIMTLAAEYLRFYGKKSHDLQAVRQAVDDLLEVVMTEMWRRPLFMIKTASPLSKYIYQRIYDRSRQDEMSRKYIRLNLFSGSDCDIMLRRHHNDDRIYHIYLVDQSDAHPVTANMQYIGHLAEKLNINEDGTYSDEVMCFAVVRSGYRDYYTKTNSMFEALENAVFNLA